MVGMINCCACRMWPACCMVCERCAEGVVPCRYILVYPQGCDVCNHLSLFLCVADYDKLLPGAQLFLDQNGVKLSGKGQTTVLTLWETNMLRTTGWSHFAQFTIAVVNKDPKKSKYSGVVSFPALYHGGAA